MKGIEINTKNKVIQLSHGGGGIKTSQLINNLILKYLGNSALNKLEDSAVLANKGGRIAFTTDSFVVNPIFFPGGDIGKLSICGTLNDLATSGCKPLALSFSLIIEEGFLLRELEKILKSIKNTLNEAGTKIVTGDTKVVEKGNADKIYINTSGIGIIESNINISPMNIQPGDKIIINGPIGNHGISILSRRKEFDFHSNVKSDCAPLSLLVSQIYPQINKVHALRDATRGGLATILLEMAESSGTRIEINSSDIPIDKEVRGICEFLGLDPLYIANEGKMVIFAQKDAAEDILKTLKENKYGKHSRIIGEVTKKGSPRLILNTEFGTTRMLDFQYGEQLPRIC
ncbi:MAG: hydrogenase expression/formation protein HypE [Actinomycetota bacterium]